VAAIADIQPAERFTLGVNYWPRRKAMRFWADFDEAEVREEFSVVAELGLHVVRIFLLWDDWQPAPDRVSTARLDDLVAVADIADELGLGLDVTFFTGHMSGPNWAPGWLVGGDDRPGGRLVVTSHRYIDSGYHNPYVNATALAAQRLQLGEVIRVMAEHPAIWMWNLGNEPDLFGRPPDHRAGRTWVSEMVELVRRYDDRHPVTCGLHAESLIADVGFRPGEVFGEVDVAVMHAYPQYVDWGREPLDPAVVPFACALTSTLAGRPVLMEEFGGCTAEPGASSFWWEWDLDGRRQRQFLAAEEELAAYVETVLSNLVRTGATGAMLWCFADYDRALWDQPPCDTARHERFFGLLRPDGTLKPHAEAVRRFAATSPTVAAAPPWAAFTDDRDEPLTEAVFYEDPTGHVRRLFPDFAEALENE
jgi:endo-1,4-beta-mannosidase